MNFELGKFIRNIDKAYVSPRVQERIEDFKERMGVRGVKVTRINNLIEVADKYSFSALANSLAVCDIDGVLVPTLGNMLTEDGKKSSLGLKNLTRKIDKIVFSSSRINLGDKEGILWKTAEPIFGGSIPRPPFLNDQAIEHLSSFVHRANRDCEVIFKIGAREKIFKSADSVAQLALSWLEDQKGMIIVVGSNFTDRNFVNKLVNTAREKNINIKERVDYFDTCRLTA